MDTTVTTYMLNLVFDMGSPSEVGDGVFLPYDSTFPAHDRSKVWLQNKPGINTPDPNNPDHWDFKQADDEPLLFKYVEGQVTRFVFRFAGKHLDLNSTGTLVTVVGRDSDRPFAGDETKQRRASPFDLGSTGRAQTTFIESPQPKPAVGWDKAWYQGPMEVKWVSNLPKFTDRYAITTSIKYSKSGTGADSDTFMFSHDPEVEIDM